MRFWFGLVIAQALLVGSLASAHDKGLKVYISADMEGIGGVSSLKVQADADGREYQKFTRLFTEEVNAAILGAYDAGATEVLVSDSHGDYKNLDVELLDPRVQLVRGGPRPLDMMQGIDTSFGAVVFLGYHAGEGQAASVIPHAFSHDQIESLNGIEVSETGWNAAIAGDFGVPVVFISGDQTTTATASQLLGSIETVTVKQAISSGAATMISPQESRRLIRLGVKRGVERRGELKPFRVTKPVQLQVIYYSVLRAELVSYIPGVKRLNGTTIAITIKDMVEASKFLIAAGALPK